MIRIGNPISPPSGGIYIGPRPWDVAAAWGGAPVSGGYVLPTPLLLDGLESSAGYTYTNLTGQTNTTNKKQGSAAVVMAGDGVNNTKIVTRTAAVSSSVDTASLGVIVAAVYVDPDSELSTPSSWIQFGRAGAYVSVVSNVDQQNIGSNPNPQTLSPGWFWHVFNVSEHAALSALGVGSLSVRYRPSSAAPFYPKISYDGLMANAAGRPTVILTFDDCLPTQYSEAFPYMQSKGLVGHCYVPSSFVGSGAGRLSLAQLQEMRAAGWGMGCDGTTDDTSMTAKASVAEAVASAQAVRSYLATNGLSGAGDDHLCYPFGDFKSTTTPVQLASMTANGSANVTVAATDSQYIGYSVLGFGIPSGATITSVVSGTQYGLSTSVPSRAALPVALVDRRPVFFNGKLQDALSAAGFKTGRTTLPGTQYSRFGVLDQAMNLPGCSTSMGSGITVAAMKAWIDQAVTRGSTAIFYIHEVTAVASAIGMTIAGFRELIDYIAAKRDAGLLDVLTMKQWWDRDGANTYPDSL